MATRIRYPLGALLALALLGSSLLALRAAPVGFDGRGAALERLAERVEGETVVFLGVDRFAGYWLRETLMRAPAGYVPEEIDNRPEKRWQQGDAVDFDNLDAGKLDKFRYAITTAAAYASAAPRNFEPIASDGDYVLWRRQGETPRSRVVAGEAGAAGVDKACISAPAARRRSVDRVPDRAGARRPRRLEGRRPGRDGDRRPGVRLRGAGAADQQPAAAAPGCVRALAPVPLAGAADGQRRRRGGRRVAAVARGLLPRRGRRGRVLARRQVRGRRRARPRSRSRRRSRAASRRRSASSAVSGSARSPQPPSMSRSSACSASRVATLITTTRSAAAPITPR